MHRMTHSPLGLGLVPTGASARKPDALEKTKTRVLLLAAAERRPPRALLLAAAERRPPTGPIGYWQQLNGAPHGPYWQQLNGAPHGPYWQQLNGAPHGSYWQQLNGAPHGSFPSEQIALTGPSVLLVLVVG
jgi:hypothetical protein